MSDKNSKPIIQLNHLVKFYQTEAGPFYALKDINIDISSGEFVAVIGKSGSGKTTLINMMTGIDYPTQGEIIINGHAIQSLDENDMAVWRGRNLGIVFQFFQLLGNLTALENVMLPMDFCGVYKPSERPQKALALLELVGLAHHAGKLPSQLSGGQQQRVAIARALANDPPIILADEPTGNLDSRTAEHIFEIFEKLVNKGKTILMVTHDRDQAKRVSKTIIIADGQVIEEYLPQIFPSLSQEQLVWLTDKMQKKNYPAGTLIIRKNDPQHKLYVVLKGKVEIVLKTSGREEFVVKVFEKGQFFGEIELLTKTQKSVATARSAPDTQVELAELDREHFLALLKQSEDTKVHFDKIARERLKENLYHLKK